MSNRSLRVYRFGVGKTRPVFVGSIDIPKRTFTYAQSNLTISERRCAISQALPLRREAYGTDDIVAFARGMRLAAAGLGGTEAITGSEPLDGVAGFVAEKGTKQSDKARSSAKYARSGAEARAVANEEASRFDETSNSQPLPFFDGLIPEGTPRIKLAHTLGVHPEDTLELLQRCGCDCAGSIMVVESNAKLFGKFVPLETGELESVLASDSTIAEGNAYSRTLLAGSHSKLALTHMPGAPIKEGWYWPLGTAGSTHILKTEVREEVTYLEYLCMSAAKACGLITPKTFLIDVAGKPVLVSERFDRYGHISAHELVVDRYHQEDIAQALGITSASKYIELDGDSVHVVAEFLRSRSSSPLNDVRSFATALLLDYLLGNCNNHLKNFALLYSADMHSVHLAPLYDIISTTFFARLPHTMSMRLGSALTIDDVRPSDLYRMARSLGITPRVLQRVARVILERADNAINSAAISMSEMFPEILYVADELLENSIERHEILEAFTNMRSN